MEDGREGKEREGKGRKGKEREGKGREAKGREGKQREAKGREGKQREGKGRNKLNILLFILQGSPQAPRSTSKSFLRKHSRSGSPVRNHPVSVRSVVPPEDKLSIPRVNADVTKVV